MPPVTLVFRNQRIHLPVGSHEVGRADGCRIILDDPHVSRRHCRLDVTDEQLVITDLGSRAGTRINGTKITGPHVAAAGDIMLLGKQQFEFSVGRAMGARAGGSSHLHGFVTCVGCGYLVFRDLKWCPVCRAALSMDEVEDTTIVRHAPPTSTISLPTPRAIIVITPNEQLLRGLGEWIASSAHTLVVAMPGFAEARAPVTLGGATVVVDVDLLEPDQAQGFRDLIAVAPASSRFLLMGPAELDFRERVAAWGLGKNVRGYLTRASSPADLLGRVQHLRAEEE